MTEEVKWSRLDRAARREQRRLKRQTWNWDTLFGEEPSLRGISRFVLACLIIIPFTGLLIVAAIYSVIYTVTWVATHVSPWFNLSWIFLILFIWIRWTLKPLKRKDKTHNDY